MVKCCCLCWESNPCDAVYTQEAYKHLVKLLIMFGERGFHQKKVVQLHSPGCIKEVHLVLTLQKAICCRTVDGRVCFPSFHLSSSDLPPFPRHLSIFFSM